MQILVLASGGLDSATLAYSLADQGHAIRLLSFDYGQRHAKELDSAQALAHRLGVPWNCIDLSDSGLSELLAGSALTDKGVDVPDGHYADASMRVTVVPNRNAMMLAIAFGIAASASCDAVAMAAHGGDHFIYPDCRPAFIDAFRQMERVSLDDGPIVDLLAPFVTLTKGEIVAVGARLGVPFAETWSCYKGGDLHCGTCGTCVERREAFELAGVDDPTEYADVVAVVG